MRIEYDFRFFFPNGPVNVHFSISWRSAGPLERTMTLYRNSKTKGIYSGTIYKFYNSILVVFVLLTNFKGRKESLKVKFQGQQWGWLHELTFPLDFKGFTLASLSLQCQATKVEFSLIKEKKKHILKSSNIHSRRAKNGISSHMYHNVVFVFLCIIDQSCLLLKV